LAPSRSKRFGGRSSTLLARGGLSPSSRLA
jgi:hypothetical protein